MSELQSIGRYEIIAELGHGAMGAVYKARDPMMDRTVAIKTILSGALSGPMAQEYRERFTREARAAGRLTHPGIVTVYDVGEFNGTPYLVMEFVDGRSLATAMDTGVRFSFDHIFEMGRQIADALGYAHRNGVIHRDIKPANILLAAGEPGEPEHAKIADLGVAKLSASQITTTGQLLGTPAFMPPEQFTGATIDGRADLFSLGVILYWLATGDKPFAGDTITAVSYKIVHSSPAPPRRINPAVPGALEQIIMKCLEKDPAARYLTGEALAADLAAGRAGRMPAAPGAASQGATETLMAPVSMMEGDPNTTLDSDARVQMAAKSQMAAAKPESIAPARPKIGQLPRGTLWIAAAVFLVLVGAIVTSRVIHHRRVLREEAAAAQAAAEQQQKQAEAEAAAKQQQTQQTAPDGSLTGAAPGTATDQGPGGQATAPTSSAAGGSANSGTSESSGGKSKGTSSEKKTAAKTTPNKTPAKSPTSAGPAPSSAGSNQPPQTNSPQAGAPQQNSQPAQNQTSASQPSTAPAVTPPPKTPPSNTVAQPQPAASGTAPASAPAEPAKIHIDDGHVPLEASFVVMMDGKVLFERKPLAEHDTDPTKDDISVPPGDHVFRVITAQGGIHIADSNTVQAVFVSKKKLLLHIDVRDISNGQSMKKTSKLEANKSDFLISVKAPNLLGF